MLDKIEVHSCTIFPFLIEASLSIYHSYLNVHVHNITQLMSCVHVANNRPKNKDLWMLKTCCFILPPFQNKRYVWWNFSQTSPNELECCKKQCKCCCWWNIMSNNILRLFNDWYLDSTASTYINAILCASVPSAQNGGLPVKLAPNVFDFTMDIPSSPEST